MATVLALSACSSSKHTSATAETSASGDKSPILVAASVGLTGPLSFYDGEWLKSIQYGIDTVNAAGGVDGRMLKLVSNDNESSVAQSVPKAQAMIAKHPALLLVSVSPDEGTPAARAAQNAGQLVMSQTGPTTFGSGLGDLVFNNSAADPTEAAVSAEFAQQQGWKKVVLVEDQAIAFTKDVCSLYKQAFNRLSPGGVVGDIQYNSTTDTTFPSQVSSVREATGAQAVVVCGLISGTPTLINEMRGSGVNLPIFGMGGGLDGTFWMKGIQNLGTFYSSSLGADNPPGGSLYPSNPNPAQKAFINAFNKKYGSTVLQIDTFSGYASIQLLVQAIKNSGGSTDSKTLAKAMDSFKNVPTIIGPTTFTPKCHVAIGRPMAITEVVNGVGKYLKTITPAAADIPKVGC